MCNLAYDNNLQIIHKQRAREFAKAKNLVGNMRLQVQHLINQSELLLRHLIYIYLVSTNA